MSVTAPPSFEGLFSEASAMLGLTGAEINWRDASWQHFVHNWLNTALTRWREQHADLDPIASALLEPLPMVMRRLVDQQVYPWQVTAHPLRTLLEMALGALRGLDNFCSKQSESLMEAVQRALSNACQPADDEGNLAAFASAWKLFQANLAQKEQALVQKELALWRANLAKTDTSRLLDHRLSQILLPDFVLAFIETEFRKLMQNVFIQYGAQSEEWTHLHAILENIIWCFKEGDQQSLRKEYSNRVSEPQAQLRKLFNQTHFNRHAVDEFFERWDEFVVQIMSGVDPHETLAAHTVEPEQDHEWIFTEDSLLKARALRVGDFVQLQQHEHKVRARLISKDLHRGLYLFANLAGLKIASLTTEELAEQLQSGTLRIIDNRPLFIQLEQFLLEQLEEEVSRLRIERKHAMERTRAAKAEAIKEELELAKNRLAQAREERKQTLAIRAREQAKARLHLEYESNLSRLKSGAWIELKQEEIWFKAQLAVILNRSQEYVFVDNKGKKLLQSSLPDLVKKMSARELRIVDYGQVLDDTLTQLVEGRRQQLKVWQQ